MLKERRLVIQKQQLGIIPILSHFYIAVSNFYVMSQSSLNIAPSKPYIVYHICFKWNFEDKVNENEIEDEVSGEVKMELINYKKDWVGEIDSKRHVWVDPLLFPSH